MPVNLESDKEHILKEIAQLEEDIKKPITRPVERNIRNNQKAWLDYYKKVFEKLK
jgi:hypothetical protein